MRRLLFSILLFLPVIGFSIDWSANDILKFHCESGFIEDQLQHYENIRFEENSVVSEVSSNTNSILDYSGTTLLFLPQSESWLRTETLFIGDAYMLASAFVNFRSIDGGEVILKLRDEDTDEILSEETFSETGSMELINIFNKRVYLSIEFTGAVELFSFGIKRKEEFVLLEEKSELSIHTVEEDVVETPNLLNQEADYLQIDFTLHVPSFVDIIIFTDEGNIADTVVKESFLMQDDYSYIWLPGEIEKELPSGNYMVYINADSVDGNSAEIVLPFTFVSQ